MKTLIVRSIVVITALFAISIVLSVIISYSAWFFVLLFPLLFLLDVVDSSQIHIIRRIPTRKQIYVVWTFITVSGISVISFYLVLKSLLDSCNPYLVCMLIFTALMTIFGFRYFTVAVKKFTKYMS